MQEGKIEKMSELLFKEAPNENKQYQKSKKREKALLIVAGIAIGLAIIGYIVIAITEGVIFAMIPVLLIVVIGIVNGLVVYNDIGKSLYIYSDKILVSRILHKDMQIDISPEQYQIILLPVVGRNPAFFKMNFVEKSTNKIMFQYKVCRLIPSRFNEEMCQWEKDLLALKCDIIDDNEIIKNRPFKNSHERINNE